MVPLSELVHVERGLIDTPRMTKDLMPVNGYEKFEQAGAAE
jgi:hypothetical protein